MKTRRTYTLDPEVADALEAQAKLRDRSFSWLVNEILARVLGTKKDGDGTPAQPAASDS